MSEYGADTLRLYEMFMGPLEADKPWSKQGVEGAKRFLDRVWRLYAEEDKIKDQENKSLDKIYNQTVKKITEDYETLNFNTAISQMMVFVNSVYKEDIFPKKYAEGFIKLLNPIAPHITEEIWNRVLGYNNTISYEVWPTYDDSKIVDDTYEMVIQVNGKVRGKENIQMNSSIEVMKQVAFDNENVKKYIEGKEIVKVIPIQNKIINIVVK